MVSQFNHIFSWGTSQAHLLLPLAVACGLPGATSGHTAFPIISL